MKTNFLCRNALLKEVVVFLRLGFSVMLMTFFCLSGYTQTSSITGQRQHLYLKLHKNDPDMPDCIKVKSLSDDSEKKFSYGYHSNINTETARLRLFEGDNIIAPDDGIGFHAQLTLMSDVPSLFVRFEVSIGEFTRTYSLKRSKLFYDKGHMPVSQNGVINIYYDGTLYQVTYNGVLIECEEPGAFSGLRQAFISTYNRLNTGGEVNFMLEPYDEGIIQNCALGCQPEIVRLTDTPPVPDISRIECSAVSPKEYQSDNQQGYIATYPNPLNHQLTVNINSIIDDDLVIEIIDATGRTVQFHSATVIAKNDNIFHFDVSTLSNGIYYIKVDAEYRFETQKITIIK